MGRPILTGAGTGVDLVVFSLGGREHAFPLDDVVEVFLMVALLPVPESPAWLLGVANVRGRTVPVVDLGARLGLDAVPIGPATPIVLMRRGERVLGHVVDAVHEVLSLPPEAVHPPDELHSGGVVSGIARSEDRTIFLLDAGALYDVAEIEAHA